VSENLDEVWPDWRDAVNMTATELEHWLATDASTSVGQSDGGESTGHRSGRRIVAILRTNKQDLSDDDVEHMRKVGGYVHRHLARRPSGDVGDSAWLLVDELGARPVGVNTLRSRSERIFTP
jgi:hypothetical protein